jgi:hypothetical protein
MKHTTGMVGMLLLVALSNLGHADTMRCGEPRVWDLETGSLGPRESPPTKGQEKRRGWMLGSLIVTPEA